MHEEDSVDARRRATDSELASLGRRLAARRGRISRTRLAAETGIDLGTLKRLEKNQVPTLAQLLRLTDFLGISPWEMLGSKRFSWKRDQTVPAVQEFGTWELLPTAPSFVNPVELELDPGSAEPEREHDGTEWLYVVHGSVELRLAGGDPIHLVQRDTIDFDGAIPHQVANLLDEPSIILRRMSVAGLTVHLNEHSGLEDH
jgi:transcriptional regulator with XRE-family HTH domain